MPDFHVTDVEERPYLYIECQSSMEPDEISRTMGEAFSRVFEFMGDNGIEPAGPPLSVYYTFDPAMIAFRAGFFVSAADAERAAGDIRADVTPAATVVRFVHTGPYAQLRDSYGELMTWLERQGHELGAPTWEVYVDDPQTTPEAERRTEVFVALG